MTSLSVLLTLGLALIGNVVGQATTSTTTTPWTTLDIPIPYPYQSPLFSLVNPDTAVLRLSSPIPCGRKGSTSFASTTTATVPLDCRGATSVSFSRHARGGCPMGAFHHEPSTVDWVTSTPFTSFAWTCSETGVTATETVQLEDVTVTLPVPVLEVTETPPELPLGLSAVHHADGRCSVGMDLEEVVDGWKDALCSKRYQYPTEWETTTTRTIGVECDGCEYVWGGDMWVRCLQKHRSLTAEAPTQTEGTTTSWIYDCVPTDD